MVKLLISIFILSVLLQAVVATKVHLTNNYEVEWNIIDNESICFQLTVDLQYPGYIGFGISNVPGMGGADIAVIVINKNGTGSIKDMHGIGNTRPVMDKKQDYKLEHLHRNGSTFHIKISRLIRTCDPEDVEIALGSTQYLIWALGTVNETTMDINYHINGRGARAVNLLDRQVKAPDLSSYKVWKLHQHVVINHHVETLYWCKLHRSPPLNVKHHIVGFSINLDDPLAKNHTHHASVLSCTPPLGEDPETYFSKYLDPKGFDCYFPQSFFPIDRCKTFDFQWAYGGTPTMFPENVGVPIGDAGSSTFYMTMLHLNNPDQLTGLSFNSGFDLYYTEKLRKMDAGFFQIGINSTKAFALTVPPNSTSYVLSSHCPEECTKTLPSDGVNIFVYLLHFHLTGRKMKVRHFRNGTELPWIANDENYDTNYQNNRLLRNEVKLLPNDHLTVECTYDSTARNGSVVLGGRALMDEMCQAFLMYYPKVNDINRCGSSVPQKDILDFMDIDNIKLPRGSNNPIVLEPEAWNGLKYNLVVEQGINWTREARWAYQQMTRYNYQEAECTLLGRGVTVTTKYPEVQKEFVPIDECKVERKPTAPTTTAAVVKEKEKAPAKPSSASSPVKVLYLNFLSILVVTFWGFVM